MLRNIKLIVIWLSKLCCYETSEGFLNSLWKKFCTQISLYTFKNTQTQMESYHNILFCNLFFSPRCFLNIFLYWYIYLYFLKGSCIVFTCLDLFNSCILKSFLISYLILYGKKYSFKDLHIMFIIFKIVKFPFSI